MNYEYLMKSWLTWASCPSTSSQTRRGLTEFRAENYEAAQDESANKTTYLRINIDMKRNNVNAKSHSSEKKIISVSNWIQIEYKPLDINRTSIETNAIHFIIG
mgnify:CR=1 FL=1